mmetsp:Transcript_1118/g.3120  ORF Transcript_1118/g.3120 Transcript_1118/m.3120 type:complete len:223 (+) Transcript_1118:792-1460(+)
MPSHPGPRHAPPRRAHQPPRRGVRSVARDFPRYLPGHRGCDHPRPLLPGQHVQVDPRARPGRGRALRGELLGVAGQESRAHAAGAQGRQGAAAHAPERARLHQADAQGPLRRIQGAPAPIRRARRHARARAPLLLIADLSATRTPPWRTCGGGPRAHQEVWGPRAHQQPRLRAAPRGNRRHCGAQRRGQVHAPQDDPWPRAAGRGGDQSGRDCQDGLRRPGA